MQEALHQGKHTSNPCDGNSGLRVQALLLLLLLQLQAMLPLETEGKQRLVFECPSRGLVGFRAAFSTITRGTGVLHRAFVRWELWPLPCCLCCPTSCGT